MQKLTRSLALVAFAATAAAQVPCYDANLGTALALGDDTYSALLPLGFSFPFNGATYTDVSVCSNGYVVFGSPVAAADWSPTVAELTTGPDARICPIWCDLNPTLAGSGQVYYNAVPASGSTPAYFSITFDGVYQYGTTTAVSRSAQLILIDGGSIQLHLGADNATATNNWLVGASQGGTAVQNPVSFTSLPIITAGNPTMHQIGTGAIGAADASTLWLPDGVGGWIVAANSTCADASSYGQGCVATHASFYEHFPTTPSIDLSNTSFRMLNLGASGYMVMPSTASFLAPGAGAANLALGDDAETVVQLTTAIPHASGSIASLNVCSNGFVSTASNGVGYQPTVAAFLSRANASWSVWRDFVCTATGPDNVYFEETGGKAIFTWLNVVGYVGTAAGATPSTFQMQFDTVSGDVDFVFLSMDTVSVSGWTGGEGWIVGYSPAGASTDPGNRDLTVAVPATFQLTAADRLPLALAASLEPVINSSISLNVSNITPTAGFGGVLMGLTNPNLSLAPLGMPGCTQYADNMIVLLFFPLGSPTASVPFNVPNLPGLDLRTQAAVFDPVAGQTPLGAVSSNGILLHLGQ